jgi:hypothetical protein
MNSYFSYMILSEFSLCVNPYTQPNLSTAYVNIDLAVAAFDDSLTLTTYAAHSVSGVSISNDDEGNIKAVLGEEILDVAEASAPADAPTAMAITPATLVAAAVSSAVAVAVPDFVLEKKEG